MMPVNYAAFQYPGTWFCSQGWQQQHLLRLPRGAGSELAMSVQTFQTASLIAKANSCYSWQMFQSWTRFVLKRGSCPQPLFLGFEMSRGFYVAGWLFSVWEGELNKWSGRHCQNQGPRGRKGKILRIICFWISSSLGNWLFISILEQLSFHLCKYIQKKIFNVQCKSWLDYIV